MGSRNPRGKDKRPNIIFGTVGGLVGGGIIVVILTIVKALLD